MVSSISGSTTSKVDAAFSWKQTLCSERGTLIAIAAGYLLLALKARLISNRSGRSGRSGQSGWSDRALAGLPGSPALPAFQAYIFNDCHRYQLATERYGFHASPSARSFFASGRFRSL